MTILHSGTTKKYSENWDAVFGGKSRKAAQAKPKKAAKKKAATRSKKSGSSAKKYRK